MSMFLICLATDIFCQLSPGPLSQDHAHLEGMANCTQCHDIGQKVPNTKCLACHEEISLLIDNNKGYHASSEVRAQECIDCHSDHHGRKFEMARFDEDAFDHQLTGYELEGQHGRIECRDCHIPDYISDSDIRSREGSFLGLDDNCISCHDDYHQNTLGNDCASCHGFESFRPAEDFDHDDADYVLRGKHIEVDCDKCHTIGMREGREFQFFTDLNFSDCIDCHDDPHDDLPGRCASCHNENSFNSESHLNAFNHSLTAFELKGQHIQTACFECHERTGSFFGLFQDQKGISENACISCHEDIHEGRFGEDCAACHNENSFLELNEGFEFDHDITDFPLEGLHIQVECRTCHETSYRDPMDHANCTDCHEDYHEGQFVNNDIVRNCDECHSVFEDFSFTSYGFEEHAETDFPLEGSHVATPCFACHLSDQEEWHFTDLDSRCVSCHDDIHEDYISDDYYPEQNCINCHNSDAWSSVDFDHGLTEWPLDGAHVQVSCRTCHFTEGDEGFTQEFLNLSTDCFTCHENIHGDQFAIEGLTDCRRCHTTSGWDSDNFDHSNTAFPLEGKHAEVECIACHDSYENGIQIFSIESFECIDCHL